MIEMTSQSSQRQQKPALTYPIEIIGLRSDARQRFAVIAQSFCSRCSDVVGAAFQRLNSLTCPIDPANGFGAAPSLAAGAA